MDDLAMSGGALAVLPVASVGAPAGTIGSMIPPSILLPPDERAAA